MYFSINKKSRIVNYNFICQNTEILDKETGNSSLPPPPPTVCYDYFENKAILPEINLGWQPYGVKSTENPHWDIEGLQCCFQIQSTERKDKEIKTRSER